MRQPTHHELEDLVRWFTYHMSQETRRKLMGDLPVHYAVLYPGVSPEVITAKVRQQIAAAASQADPLPARWNP